MFNKATKVAENMRYKARMEAAKWNAKLSSREGPAEIAGFDRIKIAYIELGTILPYPEEILEKLRTSVKIQTLELIYQKKLRRLEGDGDG